MKKDLSLSWNFILPAIESNLNEIIITATSEIRVHANILRIECIICDLRLRQQLDICDYINKELYLRASLLCEKILVFADILSKNNFDQSFCNILIDGVICLKYILDTNFKINFFEISQI